MLNAKSHMNWVVFMLLMISSFWVIFARIPFWQTVGEFVLWSVVLVGIAAYLAVALAAAVANSEQREAMWGAATRITFFGFLKMILTYSTMIGIAFLIYPTNPNLSGTLMVNTGLAMMFMVTYHDYARGPQTAKE